VFSDIRTRANDSQRVIRQRPLQDLRIILKPRISSSVVRITGMALGWIGSTIAFGSRQEATLTSE
jgi:hypothetical protein